MLNHIIFYGFFDLYRHFLAVRQRPFDSYRNYFSLEFFLCNSHGINFASFHENRRSQRDLQGSGSDQPGEFEAREPVLRPNENSSPPQGLNLAISFNRSTCPRNSCLQQYLSRPNSPKTFFESSPISVLLLNSSHRWATTFPQVKQRTGTIIFSL